jgi:hypothetical protein
MACKYGNHPKKKRCIKPLTVKQQRESDEIIVEKVIGTKRIPISKITEGDPLWRYEVKNGKIMANRKLTTYEKGILNNLDKLPPIDVAVRGKHYELLDGAHRTMLHSHKGRKTIKAQIHVYYEE